jgi:tetratricopeptide (TPR) repeat protein
VQTSYVALQPTPTSIALPAAYRVTGLVWEPQRFNNCGPANLVQAMRWYGWTETQAVVAGFIKPTPADKNTSPAELANYVNTRTNLRAVARHGGSLELVKQLLVSGFMIILETGFYDEEEPEEGWIGHYKTVQGYDDNAGLLYWLDTYKQERNDYYGNVDELWRHFNRQYIVVYQPGREAELQALLGPSWEPATNAAYAFELARQAALNAQGDPFAWWNVGVGFTLTGRYGEAALAFDQALSVGGGVPYRMMWYEFYPLEAYFRAGRYDQLITLAEYAMTTSKNEVEELFYWRARARYAKGDVAGATADLQYAIRFNGNYTAAREALAALQAGTLGN